MILFWFLKYACIAMNFPHAAFAVSHVFGCYVSIFISLNISFHFFLDLFVNCSLFGSMLFNFHVFVCSSLFSYHWFLVSYLCGWRKCFMWFHSSEIYWEFFCILPCLSWKMFHVPLKRMYILLLWAEKVRKYHLNPSGLMCHLRPLFPCWFSAWKIYPLKSMGC